METAMNHSRTSLFGLVATGGLAALVAAPVEAQPVSTWATVTQSRPIYSQVSEPQQRCYTEHVLDTEVMRIDEAPIGVRGTVIPRPGGNDLVAVPRERDVQRCNTVDNGRLQLQGYEVHYLYGGREYTTQLPYDPGQRVRVNVDVQPENR
jgi:uncharacterized protein YcfJ